MLCTSHRLSSEERKRGEENVISYVKGAVTDKDDLDYYYFRMYP